MSEDIDVGQLSEAINDKMDRDANNAEGALRSDYVIDYQEPTAENNYTWYRLYKSGWVEQGGYISISTAQTITITLPIVMANTNYSWNVGVSLDRNTATTWNQMSLLNKTTTSISILQDDVVEKSWEIKGMSAQGE